MQRIIAIDETWECDLKLELKSQSAVLKGKNSRRLQKFQFQASKEKQTMTMGYDYTGVSATYVVPYRTLLQNFEV